jgi:hypothetical protein
MRLPRQDDATTSRAMHARAAAAGAQTRAVKSETPHAVEVEIFFSFDGIG